MLAAPANGVIGMAPVAWIPGAAAVVDPPLAAAVDETCGAAVYETLAAAVVESVVAGRAALLDDTLSGIGLMITVDGTEAMTVVAAFVGPMMTTEGSGDVTTEGSGEVVALPWRVTVTWLV